LRGEVFERTNRLIPPPPHQLSVKHRPSGAQIGFNLPDLAGETIESFFVTRSIPHNLWERIQGADGLLLFVHCDHNADHTILEHPGFIDSEPATQNSSSEPPITDADPEWKLEDAAMQVKLVDLLQFIAESITLDKPMRIAVILSAWDLVEKAQTIGPGAAIALPKHPAKFLAHCWPLLHQFLESNEEMFCYRVFGASARGGGNSKAEIERLTNIDQPSERVILVDEDHRSTDLTRPVRWLLGLLDRSPSSNG
jgi:Double-GTPase 1